MLVQKYDLYIRQIEGGTIFPRNSQWKKYGNSFDRLPDAKAAEAKFKKEHPGDPGLYYETEIRDLSTIPFEKGSKMTVQKMLNFQQGTVVHGKIQKITEKAFCLGEHFPRSKMSRYFWFPISGVESIDTNSAIIHLKPWVKFTPKEVSWSNS